jgi:hypothetical protein
MAIAEAMQAQQAEEAAKAAANMAVAEPVAAPPDTPSEPAP